MTLMINSGGVKNGDLRIKTGALLSGSSSRKSTGALILFNSSHPSVHLTDDNDQYMLLKERSRKKDDIPQEGAQTS